MTLLAVNAVDAKSTNIELYASTDKGVTFKFVHRIAEGGAVDSKAVGEPHLLFQCVERMRRYKIAVADNALAISA